MAEPPDVEKCDCGVETGCAEQGKSANRWLANVGSRTQGTTRQDATHVVGSSSNPLDSSAARWTVGLALSVSHFFRIYVCREKE